MSKQMQIVQKAREALHTPYVKDQDAIPYGVDCVNFVKFAYSAVLPGDCQLSLEQDMTGFHGINDNRMIDWLVANGAVQLAEDQYEPGAIVIWYYGQYPHHSGLLTEKVHGAWWCIHASATFGEVAEHPLSGEWLLRLHSVWKFSELVS
jgi:cell wall-associated NlpC family hydrolase